MEKIQILTTCQACSGQAYLPVGDETSYTGKKYIRYMRISVQVQC
jgi:hypothetical protein